VSPNDLFDKYLDKADAVANGLCWYYRVSGAGLYREEAQSEARLALWKACLRFDPSKQGLEAKKSQQRDQLAFFNSLVGLPPPPSAKNPADNFWIWASFQIRGRVIDLFRSLKLISRMKENESYTMLASERFISTDFMEQSNDRGGVSKDWDNPILSRYHEFLESDMKADDTIKMDENHRLLEGIVETANLGTMETMVVDMFYGQEMMKAEIAEKLGVTGNAVMSSLKTAMSKLRAAAQVNRLAAEPMACTVATSESMARPMDFALILSK
jgi:RNA polymerase sigma factor (sigma-70 family)